MFPSTEVMKQTTALLGFIKREEITIMSQNSQLLFT